MKLKRRKICAYCGNPQVWEEEFKDKLWVENESGLVAGNNYKTIDITGALVKYLNLTEVWGAGSKRKVKIKVRKGCIQIERID